MSVSIQNAYLREDALSPQHKTRCLENKTPALKSDKSLACDIAYSSSSNYSPEWLTMLCISKTTWSKWHLHSWLNGCAFPSGWTNGTMFYPCITMTICFGGNKSPSKDSDDGMSALSCEEASSSRWHSTQAVHLLRHSHLKEHDAYLMRKSSPFIGHFVFSFLCLETSWIFVAFSSLPPSELYHFCFLFQHGGR